MNDSTPSVRIGPISLFALIAVICLATLAVLAVNTSRASDSLARMQADSVTQQYAAESAAQQFVGLIDASAGLPSAQAVTTIAAQVQADNADVTVTAALLPQRAPARHRRGTRGQRLPHRQVEHDSKG